VAGDWEVIDGLRFRAGYNRAVRAPNVVELFAPPNVVLDGTSDPCAGLTANNPLVQACATAFHLTPAQVLAIEDNPAEQFNGQTGGNQTLKPEISDTYTAGVVWQPSFVPGLSVSLDYFNIKVEQFIAPIGENNILDQCVKTLNPLFCGLVHRSTNPVTLGSLFLDPNGFVTDITQNTGSLKTTGVDINANYRTDLSNLGLGDNGGLSVAFVGTWLDQLDIQQLPGGPTFNCKGLFGNTCLQPSPLSPEWRHKLRVTWTTPYSYGDWFKSLSFSAQWRYISKVTLDAFSSDPNLNNPDNAFESDHRFGSRSYLDLTANFTVHNNLNFRVGVNNVFDQDPPIVGRSNCPQTFCNGETFTQVYDSLGRFVFVGLSADF